MQFCDFFVHSH